MKGCLLVTLLLVSALAAPKTSRQGRASINFTSFWTNAEINAFLVDLEAAYPQYSYLESIGTTLQGRDIWAMHITDESVNAGTKPIILVDAGLIARDWMSSMAAINLVHELVDHAYDFEQILREVEFVVIPSANPDGKEFSHTSQRAWVKNRNPNAGADCVGVNLNRNFDASWGIADSEVWNCADTYAGTGAKSERESDAISHEIEKLSARIVAYVSIQSGGQSIMYPYWYSNEAPTDNWQQQLSVAQLMRDAIFRASTVSYNVGNAAIIMNEASGTSLDYTNGLGINIPLVMRLPSGTPNPWEHPTTAINGIVFPAFEAFEALGLYVANNF